MTQRASAMVSAKAWGKTREVQDVRLFTLANDVLRVRLTDFGARLAGVDAKDRNGAVADVVLGYDDLAGYEEDTYHLGSLVGRYCNRIAHGRFSIGDETFQVPINDGENTLHGGPEGFGRKVWSAQEVAGGVEMTRVSPDGEMGFPGTLTACVRYTLEGNSLRLQFQATTDKPTVVAMTNHAYFNLSGDAQTTVLKHVLKLVLILILHQVVPMLII